MIKIKNVCKSYAEKRAVDDISFQVKKGELFAFLGVNGAGKSTTISMICGQKRADSGTILVGGYDVREHLHEIKNMIGVVFQESGLDEVLTARENLKSRAALYGITGRQFEQRLQELIHTFELEEFIDRPIRKLSGGQKRRVDIARALVHQPELLILDEPTTGLDPKTRMMIWKLIEQLRTEGLTVFLTTHYMEEAAEASYVVIIDQGKIVADGTPYELKSMYAKDKLFVYGVSEAEIETLGMAYKEIRDGYEIEITTPMLAVMLIQKYPAVFRDFELVKGRMDDVFLAITGKEQKERV